MKSVINTVLAAAVACAAALGSTAAFAQDKTIRLALQPAPILGYYVKARNLLEKRGIKPEWAEFPFSPPIFESLAAGSTDAALVGTTPLFNVIGKDDNLWYIYDELTNASGGIVKADSDIKGPADLEGKKIAFPGKASQIYSQFLVYLENSGVSESDMDLIRVNASDMNALFARDEIDAALAWPPFTTEPVRTGEARSLFTADDVMKIKGGHWIGSGWVVRPEFAENNRETVIALIDALLEARRALDENPDDVYGVLAEATGYTPETIKFMIENKYTGHFDGEMVVPDAEAFKSAYEIFDKQGAIQSPVPLGPVLDKIVKPEFAKEALAARK